MTTRNLIRTLSVLLLLTVAAPAIAQDDECSRACRSRKGLFFGVNAGWGGSMFDHKTTGNRTVSEEATPGAAGALRFGYAFNDHFGLSLETHGYGSYEDDQDWGMGAAFVTATWWPGGSGFFLRLGVGGGGGDIRIESTGETVHFEDKGAALLGLGYEWKLGRKFALGLAADAWGYELDGVSGLEDDNAAVSTVSVQFNWYL